MAAKRWRERAEPILRELTRMRLSSDCDRAVIRVEVLPGLPQRLRCLDTLPSDKGKALVAVHRPELEAYLNGSRKVRELLDQLHQLGEPWSKETENRRKTIAQAETVVRNLESSAGDSDLKKQIFEFDEDVLGTYRISDRSSDSSIQLYWGVIGAIAKMIESPVQALTAVTLIHELAHAYTHLGMDIEGRRWDTAVFAHADTAVKESLAQYYTGWTAERLRERNEPEVHKAYERLLRLQTKVYNQHLLWVELYSPEIVRAAMLELRVKSGTSYLALRRLLRTTALRLPATAQREYASYVH
ncbi:MAG: hypothetical protein M1570_02755 [Chloroflexi bacterium]|nr:hypothetical protein [Chloroflexota bacterium]